MSMEKGWTGEREREAVLRLLELDLSMASTMGQRDLVTYLELILRVIRKGDHYSG